ncbi:MAG: hypothetical protein MHM6MM_005263 [Cercozoa sp. M6MM]
MSGPLLLRHVLKHRVDLVQLKKWLQAQEGSLRVSNSPATNARGEAVQCAPHELCAAFVDFLQSQSVEFFAAAGETMKPETVSLEAELAQTETKPQDEKETEDSQGSELFEHILIHSRSMQAKKSKARASKSSKRVISNELATLKAAESKSKKPPRLPKTLFSREAKRISAIATLLLQHVRVWNKSSTPVEESVSSDVRTLSSRLHLQILLLSLLRVPVSIDFSKNAMLQVKAGVLRIFFTGGTCIAFAAAALTGSQLGVFVPETEPWLDPCLQLVPKRTLKVLAGLVDSDKTQQLTSDEFMSLVVRVFASPLARACEQLWHRNEARHAQTHSNNDKAVADALALLLRGDFRRTSPIQLPALHSRHLHGLSRASSTSTDSKVDERLFGNRETARDKILNLRRTFLSKDSSVPVFFEDETKFLHHIEKRSDLAYARSAKFQKQCKGAIAQVSAGNVAFFADLLTSVFLNDSTRLNEHASGVANETVDSLALDLDETLDLAGGHAGHLSTAARLQTLRNLSRVPLPQQCDGDDVAFDFNAQAVAAPNLCEEWKSCAYQAMRLFPGRNFLPMFLLHCDSAALSTAVQSSLWHALEEIWGAADVLIHKGQAESQRMDALNRATSLSFLCGQLIAWLHAAPGALITAARKQSPSEPMAALRDTCSFVYTEETEWWCNALTKRLRKDPCGVLPTALGALQVCTLSEPLLQSAPVKRLTRATVTVLTQVVTYLDDSRYSAWLSTLMSEIAERAFVWHGVSLCRVSTKPSRTKRAVGGGVSGVSPDGSQEDGDTEVTVSDTWHEWQHVRVTGAPSLSLSVTAQHMHLRALVQPDLVPQLQHKRLARDRARASMASVTVSGFSGRSVGDHSVGDHLSDHMSDHLCEHFGDALAEQQLNEAMLQAHQRTVQARPVSHVRAEMLWQHLVASLARSNVQGRHTLLVATACAATDTLCDVMLPRLADFAVALFQLASQLIYSASVPELRNDGLIRHELTLKADIHEKLSLLADFLTLHVRRAIFLFTRLFFKRQCSRLRHRGDVAIALSYQRLQTRISAILVHTRVVKKDALAVATTRNRILSRLQHDMTKQKRAVGSIGASFLDIRAENIPDDPVPPPRGSAVVADLISFAEFEAHKNANFPRLASAPTPKQSKPLKKKLQKTPDDAVDGGANLDKVFVSIACATMRVNPQTANASTYDRDLRRCFPDLLSLAYALATKYDDSFVARAGRINCTLRELLSRYE